MQTIEELSDIARLRAQSRTRRFDDGRIQSEPLRNVDARRRARDADFQLIGWLQGGFVESDRGVDHASRVRAVHFERRVMRGNNSDATQAAKMFCNRYRQRSAFFRIGG